MEDEQDPDEQFALCFDCLSVIPDAKAMRDPFLKAGKTGVCPFCRGPVNVVPYAAIKGLQDRRNMGLHINP